MHKRTAGALVGALIVGASILMATQSAVAGEGKWPSAVAGEGKWPTVATASSPADALGTVQLLSGGAL